MKRQLISDMIKRTTTGIFQNDSKIYDLMIFKQGFIWSSIYIPINYCCLSVQIAEDYSLACQTAEIT